MQTPFSSIAGRNRHRLHRREAPSRDTKPHEVGQEAWMSSTLSRNRRERATWRRYSDEPAPRTCLFWPRFRRPNTKIHLKLDRPGDEGRETDVVLSKRTVLEISNAAHVFHALRCLHQIHRRWSHSWSSPTIVLHPWRKPVRRGRLFSEIHLFARLQPTSAPPPGSPCMPASLRTVRDFKRGHVADLGQTFDFNGAETVQVNAGMMCTSVGASPCTTPWVTPDSRHPA